jgi:hypothetical protein
MHPGTATLADDTLPLYEAVDAGGTVRAYCVEEDDARLMAAAPALLAALKPFVLAQRICPTVQLAALTEEATARFFAAAAAAISAAEGEA